MCNFCEAAKDCLRNNIEYNIIDISSKEGLRDEMIKKQMVEEPFLKYFLMITM